MEKIEIFKNDLEIVLQKIDGFLLDSMVDYLKDKINFEIIYTEKAKNEIQEKTYNNIMKLYPKLTEETKNNIILYIDSIYYKTCKKGMEIAKKQFEAEANAYYENLAREEIKARKYSQELENYRKQHKKSWIQKLIDFI